jgi:hypothetical protein
VGAGSPGDPVCIALGNSCDAISGAISGATSGECCGGTACAQVVNGRHACAVPAAP